MIFKKQKRFKMEPVGDRQRSFIYEISLLFRDVCCNNMHIYLKKKGIEVSKEELLAIMVGVAFDATTDEALNDIRENQYKYAEDSQIKPVETEVEESKEKVEESKEKVEPKVENEVEEPKEKEPKVESEVKVETKEKKRCCFKMKRGKNEGKPCGKPCLVGEEYCKSHIKEKPETPAQSDQVTPKVVPDMFAQANEEEEKSAVIRPLNRMDLKDYEKFKEYQIETMNGFLVRQLPSGVYSAEYIKTKADEEPRELTDEERETALKYNFSVTAKLEEIKEPEKPVKKAKKKTVKKIQPTSEPEHEEPGKGKEVVEPKEPETEVSQVKDEPKKEAKEEPMVSEAKEPKAKEEPKVKEEPKKEAKADITLEDIIALGEMKVPGFGDKSPEEKIAWAKGMMAQI